MKLAQRETRYPVARTDGLLSETIDQELVIFDTEANLAHCLTPLAAAVFAHCDGTRALGDLASLAEGTLGESVSGSQVQEALAQLEARDLLVSPSPLRISRRQMVRRSAVAGVGAMAASLIFTVEPALAAPTCPVGSTCTKDNNCHGNCSPSTLNCKCNTTLSKCVCST